MGTGFTSHHTHTHTHTHTHITHTHTHWEREREGVWGRAGEDRREETRQKGKEGGGGGGAEEGCRYGEVRKSGSVPVKAGCLRPARLAPECYLSLLLRNDAPPPPPPPPPPHLLTSRTSYTYHTLSFPFLLLNTVVVG